MKSMKQASIRFLFVLLQLCFVSVTYGQNKTVKIVTFDFCPWQCIRKSTSKDPGIAIEVAKIIFESEGYKIDFVEAPYARAIKGVEDGEYDLLLNLNALTSSKVALSAEPSAYLEMNFYTSKNEKWTYKGVSSLKDIKVVSVRGYNYSPLSVAYQNYLMENEKSGRVVIVSGDNASERALQMVLNKRVTTFNEDASVFEYFVFKNHLSKAFKMVGTLGGGPLYVGFSKKSNKVAVLKEVFDQGIRKLRKSGKLAEIVSRYGVSNRIGERKTIKSKWD